MHHFTVEKTLDIEADAMWAVVSDFANLSWFSGAEKVEVVGAPGVGQIRRITMPGMDAPVDEELLAIDADSKTFSYTVLAGAVNILEGYVVDASLHAAGEGKTLARWEARFSGVSVPGVEPEQMVGVMTDTYGAMLDEMAAAARQR